MRTRRSDEGGRARRLLIGVLGLAACGGDAPATSESATGTSTTTGATTSTASTGDTTVAPDTTSVTPTGSATAVETTTGDTSTTTASGVCGDGIVDVGETCDDGDDDDSDLCPGTCQKGVCGDGFVLAGAEICDDGNLQGGDGCAPDCTPEGCAEPSQCSADLHSIIDCEGVVQETCPPEQGCTPDLTCVPACEAADLANSTVGCEYYARPTVGWCFAVYIANTWTSPVSIAVDNNGAQLDTTAFARIPTGNGKDISYAPLPNNELPPDEVAILFLAGMSCPAGIPVPPGTSGAFHITTSAPVVAYDIDPYGGGSSAITSATLLVPTSAWDTNYVAVAPWPFGPNSQPPRLTIIASEDDTEVTINPIATIDGGFLDEVPVAGTPQGVPVTYAMSTGQSLIFEQNAELTGSPILSTRPIGVIGGSGCINIDACCCDGAHQQIPPVRALGSEYVAVTHRDRVEGQDENTPWRIVGAVDGTELTYEPAPPQDAPLTLNLGQVASFRSSAPFTVKSQDAEHPFYLAGYMTGGGDFGQAGDPEFVNVIPAKQYLARYVFFADPTYPETNLVIVRAKAKDQQFKDVVLDCAGPLTGFEPVGGSGDYEFLRFDLVRFNFEKQMNCDNGRREIHSDAPFGLTVWGWGTTATQPDFMSTYVSYAYPAGASVQPINEVIVRPDPG